MITLTRRIEMYVNEADKKKKDAFYSTLWCWVHICRRAANIISSHRFAQDNIQNFFYLTEEIQYKLVNAEKDELGMLNTSAQNTVYQALSKNYKGEVPMGSMSSLNNRISATYSKNKKEIMKGNMSISCFRKNIPVPIQAAQIESLNKEKDSNYTFNLLKIPFKTKFGKDRSGNKVLFEKIFETGEYKLCDSSIQAVEKNKTHKWFLLLTYQFEPVRLKLKENKFMFCKLDLETPITFKVGKGKNIFRIGSKEEFLNHRLRIQNALRARQMNSRFSNGGHGRKRKMRGIEFFKEKEINYTKTKLHQYSSKLIQDAVNNCCGKIILLNDKPKKDKAKEQETKKDKFLLRNWSWFGLESMIEYKAAKFGIGVEKIDIEYENDSNGCSDADDSEAED